MKNLDLLAAEAAQKIIAQTQASEASAVENLVTKALGVLQENGVYAASLYLYSRSNETEKPIAGKVRENLLSLTTVLKLEKDLLDPTQISAAIALSFLTEQICQNLDRLLLIKQIWEQTLIYARYGAKARGADVEVMP